MPLKCEVGMRTKAGLTVDREKDGVLRSTGGMQISRDEAIDMSDPVTRMMAKAQIFDAIMKMEGEGSTLFNHDEVLTSDEDEPLEAVAHEILVAHPGDEDEWPDAIGNVCAGVFFAMAGTMRVDKVDTPGAQLAYTCGYQAVRTDVGEMIAMLRGDDDV